MDGNVSVSRKTSVLDHIYYKGLPTPSFAVLPTAMTDHRPVVDKFRLLQQQGGLKCKTRQNFKSVDTHAISMAINVEALSRVFLMEDVEEIHTTIVAKVAAALDLVAPLQQVQVKDRRSPLYLSPETRATINERDYAAASHDYSHGRYRHLRNKAARLAWRDKLALNVEHLQEQGMNPSPSGT